MTNWHVPADVGTMLTCLNKTLHTRASDNSTTTAERSETEKTDTIKATCLPHSGDTAVTGEAQYEAAQLKEAQAECHPTY